MALSKVKIQVSSTNVVNFLYLQIENVVVHNISKGIIYDPSHIYDVDINVPIYINAAFNKPFGSAWNIQLTIDGKLQPPILETLYNTNTGLSVHWSNS